MLVAAVLALPVAGWPEEKPAATLASVTPATDSQRGPAPRAQPDKSSFALSDDSVKKIIRSTAEAQPEPVRPTAAAAPAEQPLAIPYRAPRRLHHMDCDSFDCVAYTADNDALYTIPREQYLGMSGKNGQEQWLSCQSGNDLLSTFERYDKCRGVTIGLPNPSLGNYLQLELPKLRL